MPGVEDWARARVSEVKEGVVAPWMDVVKSRERVRRLLVERRGWDEGRVSPSLPSLQDRLIFTPL